jgi:hypothetical protein
MTPSEELAALERKMDAIITKRVTDFFADLQEIAPVGDPSLWLINQGKEKITKPIGYIGGDFRKDWTIDREGDDWVIRNGMEYASVLWDGRRMVAGRWFGSTQWPEGGDVMLERLNHDIQKDLDAL